MNLTNRRIGTFKFPMEVYEMHLLSEIVEQLKFFPVRAEQLFYDNTIEITAICQAFDSCPHGQIPELYEIRCEKFDADEDEYNYRYWFEKVNKNQIGVEE